ncbi:MAG: hypothetical protein SPK70_10630, partial [Succinivibrio dextrinosolvens]|nr:hypothetical protein [Succinivibrio dextrinosolvens]
PTKYFIISLGWADVFFAMPYTIFFFEFTVQTTHDSKDKLLEEALEQSKDKRYGEILPIKEIIRVGVVISAEDKAVVLWNVCE